MSIFCQKKIVAVFLCLVALLGVLGAQPVEEDVAKTYENALFDSSYVHKVEVTMEEGAWETLLATVIDKPKFKVTVTIDGDTYENVRFSPKGSSSLRNVAFYTFYKDRYSYKLTFNKYDRNQTYLGLDELVLNNNFRDPSCMRDALAYSLFARIGVPAPLTSYTELYINGELQGLYLAVESNETSFLNRTLSGTGSFYMPEAKILSERVEIHKEKIRTQGKKSEMPNFNPPSFAGPEETPGADLKYRGEEFENYTDIFDNAQKKVKDEDRKALVGALKALSEGRVEEALDTEEVIRYFAVHNFITSWDSYTWKMLHNYGIHEEKGRLSMIPWDYNLAFRGDVPAVTGAEDILASVIQMDIDNPGFDGVEGKDRPMWSWIVSDESYKERYHAILKEEVLPYFTSGEFEKDMASRYRLTFPYLEMDPTYNYSMEEFKEDYQNLITFCLDRAQSVQQQLAE